MTISIKQFEILFKIYLTQQNSQRWYLLERTSRRFLWCWLLLFFTSLEVFHFIAFRHHPSPFRVLHPFYAFSPAHHRVIRDTFIFIHSVIFSPRALRFWVGVFYPQAFFTLCSFVCDSGEGRNTPSRIFLSAFPHRVVPSGWHIVLNYWCLNYKTIDLSIAPVSHEV